MAALFRFEFAYYLRRPAFWLVAALFGGFGFADMVSKAGAGNAFFFVNGPAELLQTTVWYTLFAGIAVVAFVGDAFVRDDRSGIAPLVMATPASRFDLLGVRFAAAFLIALLAFSAYLPGMLLGESMSGLNPYAIGPLRADAYLLGWALVAVPNVLLLSALTFAVATRTRSLIACYVAVLVLLMVYVTAMLTVGIEQVDYRLLELWSLFDPYGYFALESATLGWTVHQHNTQLPELGSLLGNRALWLALSVLLAVLAFVLTDPRRERAAGGRSKRQSGQEGVDAARAAVAARPPAVRGVGARTPGLSALLALAAMETQAILRSRAFQLLAVCGVISLFFAVAGARSFEHSNPSTDILVFTASTYFRYVLFAIVVFYAVESMWRDRDAGMQAVIDATPVPTAYVVLSRASALFAVIALNLLGCMAVLALYQALHGYDRFEFGLSATLLFGVHGPYFFFLAVLGLFMQALTRHRYGGMGATVAVALSVIPLDAFGFFHNLYRFGATNDIGYSPMNGFGGLFAGHMWYVAYWSAVCVLLLVLTCMFWPRGSGEVHGRRAWQLATPALRRSAWVAAAASGALATWIVYNTMLLNPYQPPGKDLLAVNHERNFKQYEHLPMPVVVATRVAVDLYPSQRHFLAHGHYTLENRSGEPIREIHLSTFINLRLVDARMPGARLREAHPQWGYYIYALDVPLQPGARAELEFVTRTDAPKGFLNQVDSDDVYMVAPNDVVHNGSVLYSPFILPFVGYTKMVEHKEAWLRAKHELPPLDRRMRAHDDPAGLAQALSVSHLAWGDTDVKVSTDGDQMAVSSGRELRRWSEDGRNYARFVGEQPDRGKFTLYSARYSRYRNGDARVPIDVFHHPAHADNVPIMAKHLAQSFALYEELFGRFPYGQVRLAEFVYYPGSVYSEGGTIGLPEVLAWKSERSREGEDAMVGWLAYLLAHAWWEDQMIAADVAGGMVIREALSGYATNLYRRSQYPAEDFRRVKQKQMRDYFRALGKVDFEEPPLNDVFNEVLVARFKGTMTLELIESHIGQAALLEALREFLGQFRGRPPPYATVIDLRDALLARTPVHLQEPVRSLFEQVVTFDTELLAAQASPVGDGWALRLRARLDKLIGHGLGRQEKAAMDLPVDYVVLDAQGGEIARGRIDPSQSGRSLDLRLHARPARVVLDPDYLLPAPVSPQRTRAVTVVACRAADDC